MKYSELSQYRSLVEDYLSAFWKDKLGKHETLLAEHVNIILRTLKVSPKTFFNNLNRNRLKIGKFAAKLTDLLEKTAIRDDLDPSYIDLSLKATTPRPAIGRGEFLFCATFTNLGFAEENGDLIDLDSKKKIEVKGIHGVLGSGQSKNFVKLTNTQIFGLGELCDFQLRSLGLRDLRELEKRINPYNAFRVFSSLENTKKPNGSLVQQVARDFLKTRNLSSSICILHLIDYSRLEGIDWFLFLNDTTFLILPAPKSVEEAKEVVKNLSVGGWNVGDAGINITLK